MILDLGRNDGDGRRRHRHRRALPFHPCSGFRPDWYRRGSDGLVFCCGRAGCDWYRRPGQPRNARRWRRRGATNRRDRHSRAALGNSPERALRRADSDPDRRRRRPRLRLLLYHTLRRGTVAGSVRSKRRMGGCPCRRHGDFSSSTAAWQATGWRPIAFVWNLVGIVDLVLAIFFGATFS